MALKIALTGKMRSGKDSLAEYAIERYGFRRFAFGDALKRHFHHIFAGYIIGGKPREYYQKFGQQMRGYVPNIWVSKCFDAIVDASNEYQYVYKGVPFQPIITDLRQPNEYERCRAEGYTIIGVICDETTRIERIKAKGDAFNIDDLRHETESHVDTFDCDYYVSNNGTVGEMKAQFDKIMSELIGQSDVPTSSGAECPRN